MQEKLNEALAFQKAGRLDDAQRVYRELLSLAAKDAGPLINPANRAGVLNNLANILKDSGQIEEAVEVCRQALDLAPEDARIHSSLCYKLHFDPRSDRATTFAELREWNRRHGNRPHKPLEIDRSPNRRLRVGCVSSDFYGHAECFFALPLLKHHKRAEFEIHCYSCVRTPDLVTELFKSVAEVWHDVQSLSDDELADKIRSDRIDILVDLTMHMANNRLGVFAQKPAAVQFTWLAYPGGTGLSAIDYRLTDSHIDPGGTDDYYSEKSIRLPGTWIAYDPLGSVPPAAPRDATPVTFGSLNNPCKLNRPTLRLWSKVLSAVRDSKLLLLCESEEQRQQLRDLFGPGRVEFVGRQRRAEYLRTYNRIDICLDPVVYNGITTTCDALWMGVPVITLPGETAPSRAGLSILTNLGAPELIASDEDAFVAIAADLAGDHGRRRELRANMRARISNSPLMDTPKFARTVESAYRNSLGIPPI